MRAPLTLVGLICETGDSGCWIGTRSPATPGGALGWRLRLFVELALMRKVAEVTVRCDDTPVRNPRPGSTAAETAVSWEQVETRLRHQDGRGPRPGNDFRPGVPGDPAEHRAQATAPASAPGSASMLLIVEADSRACRPAAGSSTPTTRVEQRGNGAASFRFVQDHW